jgi:hypothetical protein
MSTLLGRRVFTQDDQQFFATISRDRNPMHVDAVAARRLMTGHQVVHGIHTVLWALDRWCASGGRAPRSVACSFANPVSVGDPVVLAVSNGVDGPISIVASVHGLACTEIRLDPGAIAPGLASSTELAGRVVRQVDPDEALDEAPGSQVGQVIAFGLADVPPDDAFPHACRALGRTTVAAIARLSYFVGMVCPGLHSVFSEARFEVAEATPASSALRFFVKRYDPRFRLFMVSFDGDIRGDIKAFVRPPPQRQPSSRELLQQVPNDAFKAMRALVIGGSRGLGELTAKIVAAGGGEVTLTYAAGADDAQRICAEIDASGVGRCRPLHLDLKATDFAALEPASESVGAVFFFATPRIFTKKAEVFDRAVFDEFVWFYLQRFHELCIWLEQRPGDRPVKVFLPSTVFITDRPRGMTEYAMAKAAAEVMVADLNRSLRRVAIVHTRLPRLATDQTASILEVSTGSSVATMLEVVRSMAA